MSEFNCALLRPRKFKALESSRNSTIAQIVATAILLGVGHLENSHAQSAVLIEAGDASLRADLAWLADRGVIDVSLTTWPISVAELMGALEGARKDRLAQVDQAALTDIRRILEDRLATAGASLSANSRPQLSTGFDETDRAQSRTEAHLQGELGSTAARIQVNGLHDPLTQRQSRVNLEGSYLGVAFLGQIAYAGQLARWWGPGHDTSLIWSDAATSIPGVGIRRGRETAPDSPFLSWIGPWGYDVNIGQLTHYGSNPNTRILAMRVHARPLRGLELGASRLIQWGGRGNGAGGSLADALVGRANTPGRPANNEIAGFDIRYSALLGKNPLTLYGQAVGEDEAGLLPAKYIALAGAQFKHAWADTRFQWHAEAADTKANRLFRHSDSGLPDVAYEHGRFKDGLYHDGLPIGAWFGGDGRIYSIGLSIAPNSPRYQIRYSVQYFQGQLDDNNARSNLEVADKLQIQGGNFSLQWKFNSITWQLTGRVARANGERQNAIGLALSVPFRL